MNRMIATHTTNGEVIPYGFTSHCHEANEILRALADPLDSVLRQPHERTSVFRMENKSAKAQFGSF